MLNKRIATILCLAVGLVAPAVMNNPVTTAQASTQPVLKYRDHGPAVAVLQQALNQVGYPCGVPDGVFGKGTLRAVKAFQTAQKVTADGVVGPGTWALLTKDRTHPGAGQTGTPQYQITTKQVLLNGKLIGSPPAFATRGTTYMPIWYVIQVLKQLQIQSTWKNSTWDLTLPTWMKPTSSGSVTGSGSASISLNGTVIEHLTGIAYRDPTSKVMTEFMPVYYVMQALKLAGVQYTWDGTHWNMTGATFKALDKQGAQIGSYSALADAQKALVDKPGGVVHDASGATVFTEPDYGAFLRPDQPAKEFTSEGAAQQAASRSSTGYVVDLLRGVVVKYPANVYTLSGSSWTSSIYGWQGTVPSFAQPGKVYLALDPNPGHSPHFVQFYLLSQNGNQYAGKLMGTYENPFRTVNLGLPAPASVTAQQIDTWFTHHSSPLQGLGSAFIAAQNLYGVDATYLLSHAVIESGWGRSSISQAKDNLFGYGAYDANPANDAGIFPSEEYAIRFQAWEVLNNYLLPGGSHYYQSPTLDGMNEHYATDADWAAAIATVMSEYSQETGGSAALYAQSNPGVTVGVPPANQEPDYLMYGATAVNLPSPYGGLPLYSDPTTAMGQMFAGVLKAGSSGGAVSRLQTALNQNGAQLTVDGQYGSNTQKAIAAYQTAHGLTASGVCTAQTWISLFPPGAQVISGTQLTVDRMQQGMIGNLVVEWYHVTAGAQSGWVDSQYVAFTNVYRLQPASGYSVPVYGPDGVTQLSTLHAGDYVVYNSGNTTGGTTGNTTGNSTGTVTGITYGTPTPGFTAIQFVDQLTGQAVVGYVSTMAVQLVLVTPPNLPSSQ